MNNKILVVDDEQSIREIIRDFLTESGYQVTLAVDGLDALEKVQFELFDLYLIDIYMPRMTGLELLEKIKQIQPLAVVIISTGYSSIDVAVKAIRSGAFHYLTKPIQAEELINVVNSGLQHSKELNETDIATVGTEEPSKDKFDHVLLKGFSHEQATEFIDLGYNINYYPGDIIELNEERGSMIYIEYGRIDILLNQIKIDTLKAGEFWGEESFLIANTCFATLTAQTDVQVRYLSRKKLIDFFTYQDESLMKRYMINMNQSMYFKFKKAMLKIGLFTGYSPFNTPPPKES